MLLKYMYSAIFGDTCSATYAPAEHMSPEHMSWNRNFYMHISVPSPICRHRNLCFGNWNQCLFYWWRWVIFPLPSSFAVFFPFPLLRYHSLPPSCLFFSSSSSFLNHRVFHFLMAVIQLVTNVNFFLNIITIHHDYCFGYVMTIIRKLALLLLLTIIIFVSI